MKKQKEQKQKKHQKPVCSRIPFNFLGSLLYIKRKMAISSAETCDL